MIFCLNIYKDLIANIIAKVNSSSIVVAQYIQRRFYFCIHTGCKVSFHKFIKRTNKWNKKITLKIEVMFAYVTNIRI